MYFDQSLMNNNFYYTCYIKTQQTLELPSKYSMLHNQVLTLSEDYPRKNEKGSKINKKGQMYTKLPSFQGLSHLKRVQKLKPLNYLKGNNPQTRNKPELNYKISLYQELKVMPQNSEKLNLMRTNTIKASKKTQILNQMIDILKFEERTTSQNPFPRKTAPNKKRAILTEQSLAFNQFVDLRQSESSTKKRGPQILSNQITRLGIQNNGPFQARRRIFSEQKSRVKTEQYRQQYSRNNLNNMEVTFYKNSTPISRTAHVERKDYDLMENEFLCKEDF